MNNETNVRQSSGSQYRCSNCSAPVDFDPAAGSLSCEYCGHAEAVKVPDLEVPEHCISEAIRKAEHRGYDRPVRRVRCENCGAVVDFDPGVVAGACAFCGASSVMESDEQPRVWRPEGILPFAITQEEATDQYKKWIAALWFRPSDLKTKSKLNKIAGVYLPFWTYDCEAKSWWTAQAGYHYYVTSSYRDSQGKSRTRQERRTRWESVSGRHRDDYFNVPVYASKGLPEPMCQGIEPYPWDRLTPYDPRYLAGFAAEEYLIDAAEGWLKGQGRISDWEKKKCAQLVPGDTHRNLMVRSQFNNARFKHVLLPVWIAAYQYNGKAYRFLVNGQTGKVEGAAPWSWVKISAATLVALVILIILLYFFSV